MDARRGMREARGSGLEGGRGRLAHGKRGWQHPSQGRHTQPRPLFVGELCLMWSEILCK